MVRKTKEDALATRELILDTAERVFLEQGVSHTSLQAIAQEAGLTRGAIYWHFKNKSDLFQAMMHRVTLPLFARMDEQTANPDLTPVERIKSNMRFALHSTVHDEQLRRVFEIATYKVEYVAEMQEISEQHLSDRKRCMHDVERLLSMAQQCGQVRADVNISTAAIGFDALMSGLLRSWLLCPNEFNLETVGEQVLGTYLTGLG